jgi:hypothetical protein
MADIVTGTVSGMVDTSGVTRDVADVRRELALESHRVSEEAGRDASNYFIANTLAETQTAKEIARSQAWTEAKVDANFAATTGQINLATAITNGHVSLEAARTNAVVLASQATITALMNATRIDELRDQSADRNAKLIELEGDARYNARLVQQNQFMALQTQIQLMNSEVQATKQSVVNIGAGTATGGAQSQNLVH